jgi:Asp-tRNA(Asn)/Glu-tRNA(Gln) amidotransferase A subunit family amidase
MTHSTSPLWNLGLCVALLVGTATALAQSSSPAPASASAEADLIERPIEDLQRDMQAGRLTSRQLVEFYLARIAAYDRQGPWLNAIAAINPKAREVASALDAERQARGPRGPLHGIPVLVKDNYETLDMPTTAGSIALAAFNPNRDAVLVQRLKAAGAVILGKTNMHELAAGIVTVGSSFGQTRNPYDLDRNPGGSSGGTGAAVAANFAAAGMGSDTCGSIRIPAAHNNLVGLRGTQGLSSRTGIVPLSSTQDISGPLARTMTDLAIMLDATVGPDPADPSTAVSTGRIPASYRAALRADAIRDARIGVLRSLFGSAQEDREVATIVEKSLDALKAAGADIVDVTIPGLDDLLQNSSLINADFKFDLADYLASAGNAPVKGLGEMLDRGLVHSSMEANFRARDKAERRDTEESRRARIKRVALQQAVTSVLAEHRLTALLYPTIRRKAARIGESQGGSNCQLSAHSGLPALGVPAGFTDDGLPVGIDLLGGAFTESELLSLGYSIEQTLKLRKPPFGTPSLLAGHAPPRRIARARFSVPAHGAEDGSTATLDLGYEESTSRLSYSLSADAATLERIAAVWIHAGTVAKPGAARHQLFGGGQGATDSIRLSAADRTSIADGGLFVRIHRRGGAAPLDLQLSIPR